MHFEIALAGKQHKKEAKVKEIANNMAITGQLYFGVPVRAVRLHSCGRSSKHHWL